ncbi:hypothetical protein N3K66_006294 [Trichothecium roseum]|uniref:Uncharacterized protein n=1 Tax=Trichothecium roseum TaxID=47278 RepID=A0ACC0UUZ5_9HYPO|nr:hypothetical protein N3K66_006294 [Trichothecium roseum]
MASKVGSLGHFQGPNGHLFFERQGNPDGQSILFIHGLGGTTNAFQNLVPNLQDCDIIRFDWSGHGRSAIPQSSSLGSYVADCEAIIGHLGLQSIVVVAHSLGGLIALHLAAKISDAVKALVLLGPVRPPSKDGQEALSARAEAVRKHGMGNIADTVVSNAFSSESLVKRKAEAALAREMLTRQNSHGYALAVEALRDSDAPQWARIKSKTIIVSGEQDKGVPGDST